MKAKLLSLVFEVFPSDIYIYKIIYFDGFSEGFSPWGGFLGCLLGFLMGFPFVVDP